MATETTSSAAIEEEVSAFLQRELPQIQLHGGDASIVDLNLESGTVHLNLSGACSGCGISPMTIQAIKSRLPQEVPQIEEAKVETGSPKPSKKSEADNSGDDHHGMGGHPAGGGISMDFEGEIPEWRRDD